MRFTGRSFAVAAVSTAVLAVASVNAQIRERALEELAELGREHHSAWALYEALRDEAGGGQPLSWTNLPPWTGIYSRTGGLPYDVGRPAGVLTTAKLTPEYRARFEETLRLREQGIEYDPLSDCHPPGYPRWLTEPNLREFVVYPHQTWLMNELVNDVRRVYTDGRGHTPPEEQYPLYNGDSIGFWDGHKLIVHTNQLMAGQYQRAHPNHSDQIETVEIWQQAEDSSIQVDVWAFDPPGLEEPWHTRHTYARLDDPEKRLRIRYWNCNENQNNETFLTEDGATDFRDLTFTTQDDDCCDQ